MAQDRRTPSAEEAATLLAAAREARQRSRRAAVGAALRASLVFWGLDWMAGYTLVQFWPGWPALVLWGVASLGLYALPRLRAAPAELVVSGWETRFQRSWWVILGGSVACAIVVTPATIATYVLLLGAVWGIAYALYGVIADDREIAALGGVIIALAAVTRLVAPAGALVIFGLVAGGGTALLGLLRLRRGL